MSGSSLTQGSTVKPYINLTVDFLGSGPKPAPWGSKTSYGIWLVFDEFSQDGRYRLMGGDKFDNPNDLLSFWQKLATQMGGIEVRPDEVYLALCQDFKEGNESFVHVAEYQYKRWVETNSQKGGK